MEVNIIGPFPPPIGGISIHVLRLCQCLKKENINFKIFDDSGLQDFAFARRCYHFLKRTKTNYSPVDNIKINANDFNIINLKSFKKLFFHFLFSNHPKARIIHYHTGSWKYRAALVLLNLINSKNKIILTIHSLRDEYANLSWKDKIYLKFSVKHASHFVVTNPVIKEKITSWGALKERIDIIPAYLPPEENKRDFEEIPEDVWNFIQKHQPIISANAFMIRFYNGQDLYGTDMCIELCTRLKKDFTNIGFVFSLPNIGDYEYFKKMHTRIGENMIKDNFLFITKAYQFYPILMKSDIFVRPTNTEGDSLSIRESLQFKVPVVASDVAERAEGTILFKNRDLDDFYEKVKDVLDNYDKHKKRLEEVVMEDNAQKIMEIYKKVVNS